MATIVREKSTGQQYILIGTGFGSYHSSTDHWFMGSLSPNQKAGQYPMVCLCDTAGEIGWMYSHDVQVVSIDGHAPSAHHQDNARP